MPIEKDDVSQMLGAHATALKNVWQDSFSAFAQQHQVKIDYEAKMLDQRSRAVDSWKYLFQMMLATTALLLTLFSVFGIIKFNEWSNLADRLMKQETNFQKLSEEQGRTNQQAKDQTAQIDRDFVDFLLDQMFADLDETMDSMSPYRPSTDIAFNQQRIVQDVVRIKHMKDALAARVANLQPENRMLDLLAVVDELVYEALNRVPNSSAAISLKDTNELREAERKWRDLSMLKDDFPIAWHAYLEHLDAYRDYVFGTIESQRFAASSSSPQHGIMAQKYFESSWHKHRYIARAYSSDATLRIQLLRLKYNPMKDPRPSPVDAQTYLDELDEIVGLFNESIGVSTHEWVTAAAESNLANVYYDQALLLWQIERTNDARTALENAERSAESAREYTAAPPQCFVTAAEIICVRLKLEAPADHNAERDKAEKRWTEISGLMNTAIVRNWKRPASYNELLERCPAFKYLDGLGDPWTQRLQEFIAGTQAEEK